MTHDTLPDQGNWAHSLAFSHLLTAVLELFALPLISYVPGLKGYFPTCPKGMRAFSSWTNDLWAPDAALSMTPNNTWRSTQQFVIRWLSPQLERKFHGHRGFFCSPLYLHVEEALGHSWFLLYVFRKHKAYHILLISTSVTLFWASDLVVSSLWMTPIFWDVFTYV